MPEWAIDHISAVTLAVRDMPESVAFYERLGLQVSYGGSHAAFTTRPSQTRGWKKADDQRQSDC